MMYEQPIYPAIVCGLLGSVCYAFYKNAPAGTFRDAMLYCGIALFLYTLVVGIFAAMERTPTIIRAFGDYVEQRDHPDIALTRNLRNADNADKIMDYIYAERGFMEITNDDGPRWKLYKNGRHLTPTWISAYLDKSLAFHPELSPLGVLGNKSEEQMNEQAFIYYGVDEGWFIPRDGRTFVWSAKWNPEKVRDELF